MVIEIKIHQLCQVWISGVNLANTDDLFECFFLCCVLCFPSSLTAFHFLQTSDALQHFCISYAL